MRKSRFSVEQIVAVLRQEEMGMPIADVTRQLGVSEQTFYRWKKVYSGLGVGELRRLKLLEEENRNLTQLVADLSLDRWTSAGRVSRRTIPSWSRSTGGCGSSA